MSNGFGSVTPSVKGGQYGNHTHKIAGNDKDKSAKTITTVRLAPPMKAMANDPRGWRMPFWGHYGYQIPSSRDATKLVDILFPCVRQWGRGGIVERECPEEIAVNGMKAKVESLGGKIESGKVVIPSGLPDNVVTELRLLSEWLRRHNVDSKYRLNAWDQNWVPGRFLVPRNTFKTLDTKIEDMLGNGFNPFDLEKGCWFKFTRTGNGFGTQDVVEVLREGGMDGPIKSAAVPQSARDAALMEWKDGGMPSVNDPAPAYVLTYDQVQAVVNAGEDPQAVAKIIGIAQRVQVPVPPALVTPTPQIVTTSGLPPGLVQSQGSAGAAATTMTQDYPAAALPTQFRAAEDQQQALAQVFQQPAGPTLAPAQPAHDFGPPPATPKDPSQYTEADIIAMLNAAKK